MHGVDGGVWHIRLVQQACCWGVKRKYGEAGVGSGGDEEDEGGRHRNRQSPHQGLYNIFACSYEHKGVYLFLTCVFVFVGGLRGHRKPHHSPHTHSSTLPFHPGRFLLNPALPCPLLYPGSCYSCLPTNCLSENHHATVHRGSGQQPPLLGLYRQQLPGDAG